MADAGVLDFAFRVFVDGFEHAVWAGVSAFFIGIAINYPRRRWQLIALGISIVAVLHGLNDWSVSTFNSYWPGILIQAISLLLFLGYTMSASSIELQVRRTPLFRGDSIVMDAFSEPRKPAAPEQRGRPPDGLMRRPQGRLGPVPRAGNDGITPEVFTPAAKDADGDRRSGLPAAVAVT